MKQPRVKSARKVDLIDAIARAIPRWQDAVGKFDEAVGRRYGLGVAERHCLAVLVEGPRTASEIARDVSLSPAAVTALLDRLEARHLVKRARDKADRRKVLVALGDAAFEIVARYLPIAKEGRKRLASMTEAELAAVAKFVDMALDLQRRFNDTIVAEGES